MSFKVTIALVILILCGLFMAQNFQVVEVRFLFWRFEMSRIVLMAGPLLAGVGIGWIARSFARR